MNYLPETVTMPWWLYGPAGVLLLLAGMMLAGSLRHLRRALGMTTLQDRMVVVRHEVRWAVARDRGRHNVLVRPVISGRVQMPAEAKAAPDEWDCTLRRPTARTWQNFHVVEPVSPSGLAGLQPMPDAVPLPVAKVQPWAVLNHNVPRHAAGVR